ncbi:hypothetical protein MVEN_01025000 [Mycena venus]|uniref:Vacuolar protein 8 n=1 Tax=Mycena venus TaxID=2733690 RepID=A0A8H7D2D2_9AGAR|nr:hypothetical protein MVEN_01025000 [Mycena venus]
MSYLAHQESRVSLISWWSDSNPGLQGPTINLHTVAKPLMKWMYYRQAVDIIKKHRGRPLSVETLEIYSSYLPLNYVSWATKVAIWAELADRTTSQDDARAVVDSHIFPYLVQMLWSPDPGPRTTKIRTLFGEAVYALAQIARRTEGAQAIVEAKALNHVLKLLESPNPDIRGWSSQLVGRLASHELTALAIRELKVGERLMSLLQDDSQVVEWGTFALSQITERLDDAKAIIDIKAAGNILNLLESAGPNVQKWTCELVGTLADYESTAPAMWELNACEPLLSLLRTDNPQATEWAVGALSRIALGFDGAQTILNAKAMDRILILLESPIPKIREYTCVLVGHLATHESIAQTILKLKPCVRLVSLLEHAYTGVIQGAMDALCRIAKWEDGAQAVVDAMVMNYLPTSLESPDSGVRCWTCRLLGNLASHRYSAFAVQNLKPYARLVSLLRDPDHNTLDGAIFALDVISEWPVGAAALADIDCSALEELRDDRSVDLETQVQAHSILKNIARNKARLTT